MSAARLARIVPLCAGLVLLGFGRSASAANEPSPVDAGAAAESDPAPEPQGSRGADAGTALPPAPPPAAPTPFAPAPTPPQPTYAPPAVLPTPEPARPSEDAWPIEYVLRPQTIPAGKMEAYLSAEDVMVDPPPGVAFHGFLTAGGGVSFGVTDRVEFSTYVPSLLCGSDGDPSGCSDYSRINGSGLGFAFGVLRTHALQLALTSDLYIALTTPLTFAVSGEGWGKWLIGRRVALQLSVSASKAIGPPRGYTPLEYGNGRASLSVDVQLSRHLLIWAGLSPYAPFDHLGEPKLEPYGGLSWTFENAMQLSASGGIFNVLPRHPWDISLPGKYATLSLSFWL